MAGRGDVDDVVEELDERHRAGDAGLARVSVGGSSERGPLGEDPVGQPRPVEGDGGEGRGGGSRAGGGAGSAGVCAATAAGLIGGGRHARAAVPLLAFPVDEQHCRTVRGARLGALEYPDLHADVERVCGTGRQGDNGPQRPAADEFRADTATRGAEGQRGRQQHDRVAADRQVSEGVLRPGQLGFGTRRDPVRPSGVVCQLVVAPVAVGEGRVGQDGVDGDVGEGVVAQAVAGADHHVGLRDGDEEPDRAPLHLDGQRVLTEQLPCALPGRGGQQRAASAGGIEDPGGAGRQQPSHEQGQALRGLVDAACGTFIQLALGEDVEGGLRSGRTNAIEQCTDRARVARAIADRLGLRHGSREFTRGLLHCGDELVVGRGGEFGQFLGLEPGYGCHHQEQPPDHTRAGSEQAQRRVKLLGRRGTGGVSAPQ